jgi:hypothetical protein
MKSVSGRLLATAAAVSLLVTLGTPTAGATPKVARTITLRQAPPTLTTLALDPAGSIGDEIIYEAALTRKGRPSGAIFGSITGIGSLQAGLRTDRETRLSIGVFELPEGQISVQGLTYYDPAAREIATSEPATRAVVGGTGKYLGARGEVITRRLPDGSYVHTIRLVD